MLAFSVNRRRLWKAGLLGLTLLVAPALAALAADGSSTIGVVNVNTATIEELQVLPGIGETRARAIVEARKARGGFKNVDELVEIRGIGPSSLERLRPYVTLTGKTRIPSNHRPR